ncbi:MAG: hypothetical protein GY870_09540 [archaeon]|nr:hypothetical protein [archaeon]
MNFIKEHKTESAVIFIIISLLIFTFVMMPNYRYKYHRKLEATVEEKYFEEEECDIEIDVDGYPSLECEGPFYVTIVSNNFVKLINSSREYYNKYKTGDTVIINAKDRFIITEEEGTEKETFDETIYSF